MKLAINGGTPVRKTLFPPYITIGDEEKKKVNKVLDSGILSRFLGCWHNDFYGGPEIQALEKEWSDYYSVKHSIAINSCTSGLYTAMGAIGIEPGDEVIVTPYSMSASAVAPLVYNAIPVFADIEKDYYCLDPESLKNCITKKTKAIIVVDIFGLPYNATEINTIAKENNLLVIEDCAQAPGAKYFDKYAGTLADIGVFSLNYHKHIHCGEGGIIVTDNDKLAEKLRLIRNHAEAVVEDKGITDLTNMLGFNYRMTEIEAAISRCQIKKLKSLLKIRQNNCNYLREALAEISAIRPAQIRQNCTHSYYILPFSFSAETTALHRNTFIKAVCAELQPTKLRESEGVKITSGYVKPLYLQPLFQNKILYGSQHYPFNLIKDSKNIYHKGICPVAEKMYYDKLFFIDLIHPGMEKSDLDDVVEAFYKVWENKREISQLK